MPKKTTAASAEKLIEHDTELKETIIKEIRAIMDSHPYAHTLNMQISLLREEGELKANVDFLVKESLV